MARGGYGNTGVPLHERVRVDVTDARAGACPAKHCWISLPVDGSEPRPGLLLEWRKGDVGRWEGRVVYVAALRPGAWATVEEWIPAELLTTG
ncbi:MAG: hypothetical protein V9G04_09560 [Nocardioides sp.]|jgi:hypothetical protein